MFHWDSLYECTKNRVGVTAVSTGSVGNNNIFFAERVLQTDIALIVLFSTRYAGSVGNNNIFLLQHACCIFGVLIVLFSGPRATFCFSVKVPFGGLKIPKYFGVGALAFCDNTCFFGANLFSAPAV